MKQSMRFTLRRLPSALVLAGVLGQACINPAHADEVGDLKALVQKLQERVDQLEQRNTQSATVATPAPATAGTTASAAPAPAASATPDTATGFKWNFYGRADVGYTHSKALASTGNVVTTDRFGQGEMASRLGLNGAWQFDPDFKAIFAVETGINLNSGSAGGGTQNDTANSSVLFNRGATAGFASSKYGSIEGGTMYMSPFWVTLGADQASANNYGYSDFSGLVSVVRPEALARYLKDPSNANGTSSTTGGESGTALFYANSVRYRTPDFHGVTGELAYSNGQQATTATTPQKNDGRTLAGNVLYKHGNLFAGYAHMTYLQDADIASAGSSSIWQTRHHLTDTLGLRYKWGDFTLGGALVQYRVTDAGGYRARAAALSSAYDIGRNRIELSVGRVTYENASAAGAYGTNAGDGKGDPASTSVGLGYLYNFNKNLSLYTYYNKVFNNDHANLGVMENRSDSSSKYYGYSPSEISVGAFYTF